MYKIKEQFFKNAFKWGAMNPTGKKREREPRTKREQRKHDKFMKKMLAGCEDILGR